MAYATGVAANHADLLLKLETFLTTNPDLVRLGQQWKVKKDNLINPYSTDTTPNSDGYALPRFFIGNGLDGEDEIVVPVVLRSNTTQNYYTLNAYMARNYDANKGVSQQFADNARNAAYVSISLWHTQMPYWFIASGRRFIVIVKVSHRYSSMYCGFILPSGTDLEYPYPLALGGNHCRNTLPFSNENQAYCRSFFNPQAGADNRSANLMMFSPANEFVYFDNYGGGYINPENYNKACTYPYYYNVFFSKTLDGEYVLSPIDLIQHHINKQHLGWFDGVMHVSGVENSPENILTVNGKQYICFPALIQNGYNDWAAFCLE